jgi:tetratricopeptide (TPR) repeat protein
MRKEEDEAGRAYEEASASHGRVSPERALELWLRAADLCRRAGNQRRYGDCLNNAGLALNQLGRFREADDRFAGALAAYRAAGDHRRIALALLNQGISLLDRGEVRQAVETVERAVALLRDFGDEEDVAGGLVYLARGYGEAGAVESAVAALEDAARLYGSAGNGAGRAEALTHLASMLIESAPARAEGLLRESAALAERTQAEQTWMVALMSLAELLRRTDRADEAISVLRTAAAQLRTADAPPELAAEALLMLGTLSAEQGDERLTLDSCEEAFRIYDLLGDDVGAVRALAPVSSLLAEQIREIRQQYPEVPGRQETDTPDEVAQQAIGEQLDDRLLEIEQISVDSEDAAIELLQRMIRADTQEALQRIIIHHATEYHQIFHASLSFNVERALQQGDSVRARAFRELAEFIVGTQRAALRTARLLYQQLVVEDRDVSVEVAPGTRATPIPESVPENEAFNRAIADSLHREGHELLRMNRPRVAFERFGNALELFQHLGYRRGIAESLGNLGLSAQLFGDLETAINYAQKAHQSFEELNDTAGQGHALGLLGSIQHKRGQDTEALQYYKRAHTLARQSHDRTGEAEALSNIGAMCHVLGRTQEALLWWEQALALKRQLDEPRLLVSTLSNLAAVYREMGRTSDSDAMLDEARQILQDIGDQRQLATLLSNQAVQLQNEAPMQAESLFREAGNLARAADDPFLEAKTLENLGTILRNRGRFEEMTRALEAAAEIYQRVGHRPGLKRVLLMQAEGAIFQGDSPRAADAYEQALEQFADELDLFERIVILGNLSQSLAEVGERKRSTHYRAQLEQVVMPLLHADADDSNRRTIIQSCLAFARLAVQQQENFSTALNALEHGESLAAEAGWTGDVAQLREEQASLLRRVGRHTESLQRHREALQIATERDDEHFCGLILANMATALRELGRLGDAEEHFRQALEIARRLGNRGLEAFILTKLAALTFDLGRRDETLRLYFDAAEIARSLGNRYTEAQATLGAAGIALDSDDPATTEAMTRQVLEFGDELSGEHRAQALGILALALRGQRRHADALATIERAIAIAESLTAIERATTFFYAAVIHAEMEDRSRALQRLKEALTIIGDIAISPLTANVHQKRGDIYYALGDTESACQAYEQAFRHLQKLRRNVLYEEDRLGFLRDLALIPEKLVGVLLERNQIIDAFSVLEAAKSRAFLERLALSELSVPDSIPTDKREEDERLRQRIRTLEYGVRVAKTDRQRERLVRELGQLLPQQGPLLDEIRAYAPEYDDLRRGATVSFAEAKELLAI